MIAVVSTAKVQPGKMDELMKAWRENVEPLLDGIPGLKQHYMLTKPDTDEGMAIALYESEADAQAFQNSGKLQEMYASFASYMIMETIVREIYEVSAHG